MLQVSIFSMNPENITKIYSHDFQQEETVLKRMCRIQLTRTINEKWMKNIPECLQQAQELIDESASEEFDDNHKQYASVSACLFEKGQFMQRICTMTDDLEQAWLIEMYAQDYYGWQKIINKYHYDKNQQSIANTCKLNYKHRKISNSNNS